MCNAWNHPSGCMCGWGGDGHLGGGGNGGGCYAGNTSSFFSSSKIIIRKRSSTSNFFISFDTFINPNATCPICGEQVFFYQSPDGGKVYFDSLGPPWPKHPCTDNNFPSSINRGSHQVVFSWKDDGWHPFIIKKVNDIDNETVQIVGYTVHDNKDIILYTNKSPYCHVKMQLNLFQIKNNKDNTYLISTFSLELGVNIPVKEHIFIGSVNRISVKKRIDNVLNKNESKLSPMELAFKKALDK